MTETPKQHGRLFVISGPSGVGKGTITAEVIKRSGAQLSVSATTRQPRRGEIDGTHYRFCSVDQFRQMIAADKLLEWAEVFGNYYGTPAEPVEAATEAGKNVILEIDVQGGLQVVKNRPDAVLILITPPSEAELARRLTSRATDAPDVIARRLAKANSELKLARESGRYNYEVVNDELQDAIERVLEIMENNQ